MAESKKLPRKKLSTDNETAVLIKSARRCSLCFHLSGDLAEKVGQIAHLDDDRTNGAEDNLAWMCWPHHTQYDSTTSQHKNYTIHEVKTARSKLYEAVANEKHIIARVSEPPSSNVRLEELRLSTLYKLHTTLVEGHYEINRRAKAVLPKTEEEYRTQVEVHRSNFLNAFTLAEIYLDSETNDAMRNVLGSLRQMCRSIWLRLPEVFESQGRYEDADIREPDWPLFTNSFDGAQARLRALLNPNSERPQL